MGANFEKYFVVYDFTLPLGQNWPKKMLLGPFLTPAETKITVILSALVKRFGVSRMQDFFWATKCLVALQNI